MKPSMAHPNTTRLREAGYQSVLVVEDDPQQAGLFRHWLEQDADTQYDVRVIANGSLAWDVLRDRPWGLVISDLLLPGLDGLTLLERLRAFDTITPFMLMSGQTSFETLRRAITLNATDFLPKPFQRTDFLDATAKAIGSHRQGQARRNTQQATSLSRQTLRLVTEGQQLIHRLSNDLSPAVAAADLITAECARPSLNRSSLTELAHRLSVSTDVALGTLLQFRALITYSHSEDNYQSDLTFLMHASLMMARAAMNARRVDLQAALPPAPVPVLGGEMTIRTLLTGLMLALAEDSELLDIHAIQVHLITEGSRPTAVFTLHNRSRATTGDSNMLDGLIGIFAQVALGLSAMVTRASAPDGNAAIHVSFQGLSAHDAA